MGSNIPLKDKKILLIKSGNRCAMPKCRKELVIDRTPRDRESIIGEIAHIQGEKPSSARYDPNISDEEKNSCDNLIFLCRACHKVIDDQPNKFTVEKLHEIKRKHEKWIIASTREEIIKVTFAELNIVTKYLVSGQPTLSESYAIIPPRDKIRRNRLSSTSEQLIIMGLTQVKQVADFINKCPDIDTSDRLKRGFVKEYNRLKNVENLLGDDLFNSLLDFASGGSNDFKQKAAGLAVLVYLFEKCEVFEK